MEERTKTVFEIGLLIVVIWQELVVGQMPYVQRYVIFLTNVTIPRYFRKNYFLDFVALVRGRFGGRFFLRRCGQRRE